MRKFLSKLVFISLLLSFCDSLRADLLDPLDFSSLATALDPNSTLVIDTGTDGDPNSVPSITIDGGSAILGVVDDQGGLASPGSVAEIAVFTFGDIDLSNTVTVSVTGTRALGLLSQGDATIDTTVSVNGAGDGSDCDDSCVGEAGGPGGYAGGLGTTDGLGPGGGGFTSDQQIFSSSSGAGAGFGSAGQPGFGVGTVGAAGASYGELLSTLQGGSGGGGAVNENQLSRPVGGGGGGGALELGATGSITIAANGVLEANGGIGGEVLAGTGLNFGGNGSGGGIRVHGATLNLLGQINAKGGSKAPIGEQRPGGGGRVFTSGATLSFAYVVGETIDFSAETQGFDVSPGEGLVAPFDHGVVAVSPNLTIVPFGESLELGSVTVGQTASPTQPRVELLFRNVQITSTGEASVPTGGHTNRFEIELRSPLSSITTPDPNAALTNQGVLRGTGSVEVVVFNDLGGEINAVNDTLVFTELVINNTGAQINAINSTLQFDSGLTNIGEMNLINATILGTITNTVISTATLVGSNSVSADYAMASGDTLSLDLGGTLPGEFDTLTIGGNATLAGDLDLSLDPGFSLTVGDEFEIIDIAGTASGTFSGLADGESLGNFGGVELVIDYDGGDGNDVTLLALWPGDFNFDGSVDGLDFLFWQRDPDVGALSDWEANYGLSAQTTATAATAAVPEPTTFMLFLALICLAIGRQPSI